MNAHVIPLRNSNVELLRILAMLGIVSHHFAVHGAFKFSTNACTFDCAWIQFLALWGKAGVNIFIFITGYFSVPNHSETWEFRCNMCASFCKVIYIWMIVLFWSLFTNALGILVHDSGGINAIIITVQSFFPLLSCKWWFATDYCLLMLFSPFINFFLNRLDDRLYRKILLICIIPVSIVPTLLYSMRPITDGLLFVIFIYCLDGYQKRRKNLSCSIYLMISLLNLCFIYGITIICDILGVKYHAFLEISTHLYKMYSLPMIFFSGSLFMFFISVKPFYSKIINIISPAMFGVYLIHDSDFGQFLFWQHLFNRQCFNLVFYSLAAIISTFILCLFAESLRKQLFVAIGSIIAWPKIRTSVENILCGKICNK